MGIVTLVYLIVIFVFIIANIFIAYHILRYSLNPRTMVATLVIFLSVSVTLLLFNLFFFFSTDWRGFLFELI